MIITNGSLIFVYSENGSALFDIVAKKQVFSLEWPLTHAEISNNGQYIATCADDKIFRLFSSDSGALIFQKNVPRRLSSIRFNKNDTAIIIADKFGDIHSIATDGKVQAQQAKAKVDKTTSQGVELICGHVSMVTDFRFSHDFQLMVSCDRDEKIRVHRYPEAFIIHGFCFGHTEYVSALCVPRFNENIIVSGGGDPLIRAWDPVACKSLATFNIYEALLEAGEEDLLHNSIRIIDSLSTGTLIVVNDKSWRLLLIDVSSTFEFTVRQVLTTPGYIVSVSVDSNDFIWAVALDVTSTFGAVYKFTPDANSGAYDSAIVDDFIKVGTNPLLVEAKPAVLFNVDSLLRKSRGGGENTGDWDAIGNNKRNKKAKTEGQNESDDE